MPQWLKIALSLCIAGLTTYGGVESAGGTPMEASIAAAVAMLNALGNLYTKKPNQQ